MENTVVFFVTCPGPGEGERIAKHLLRQRLAACVNVIPRIRSFYYWEGKINDEGETLLVCKTAADRVPEFIDTVRQVHTFSLPEIVGIEASVVDRRYGKWVFEGTRPLPPEDD
jgi:periplasmic divalent cation tolerance protein